MHPRTVRPHGMLTQQAARHSRLLRPVFPNSPVTLTARLYTWKHLVLISSLSPGTIAPEPSTPQIHMLFFVSAAKRTVPGGKRVEGGWGKRLRLAFSGPEPPHSERREKNKSRLTTRCRLFLICSPVAKQRRERSS